MSIVEEQSSLVAALYFYAFNDFNIWEDAPHFTIRKTLGPEDISIQYEIVPD